MTVFPSRKQKHTYKTDDVHAVTTHNGAAATLFSKRNRIIALVTAAGGLSVGLVGFDPARATTSTDASVAKPEPASKAVSKPYQPSTPKAPTLPRSAPSAPKADDFNVGATTNVTVNGKRVPLGKDGDLHKVMQSKNNRVEVDIETNTGSSASTQANSSLNIDMHTRSFTSAEASR